MDRVQFEKTKLTVSGGTIKDWMSISKVYPCGIRGLAEKPK